MFSQKYKILMYDYIVGYGFNTIYSNQLKCCRLIDNFLENIFVIEFGIF